MACCAEEHQIGLARSTKRRALGLGRLFSAFAAMSQVARERRALRRLDGHALKDLGLSRADVEREATRAPWDLPTDRG